MTLVGDDDLELDIRIRDIGSHLRAAGGHDLWRCQLRYMALLQLPEMKETGNPVGSEAICQGLWALCFQSNCDLEQKLALLDHIEEHFRRQLPALYRELDELLADHGVERMPAQSTPDTVATRSDANRWSGSGSGSGETMANPLSTLQQTMRLRLDAGQPARATPATGDTGPRSGNATLDAAAMMMLKHLLHRLTTLEDRAASAGTTVVAAASRPPMPLHALKSMDLDLPLGKPEAITIDTMALIFESIFDDADLPDAVKASIWRLQIPLLKRAIVDPSLFADSQHPARLLINRMARAAIGLPRGTRWEHPICERIAAVTTAARGPLEERNAALDPFLAELDVLIAERDEAIRLAADGHVLLVVEHEKKLFAEQRAGEWLRASLARTGSREIASFLEKHWLRVMRAAALAAGTDGTRWQQNGATAQELIWSVQPKHTADERKRLASMASSLVSRIGAGLDEIGIASSDKRDFLNTLFELQTGALRAQAPVTASPPVVPGESHRDNPGADLVENRGARVLTDNGSQVQYLGLAVKASPPTRPSAAVWQVGDWLRFCLPDKKPQCGLCCWQSPSSATVVLFNPDWDGAVAMPPAVLAQQITDGRAQVISRIAIFDTAAERALGLLDQH